MGPNGCPKPKTEDKMLGKTELDEELAILAEMSLDGLQKSGLPNWFQTQSNSGFNRSFHSIGRIMYARKIKIGIWPIPQGLGLSSSDCPFAPSPLGLAQQFPPAAINLGTFSLQRSPYTGDLQVGLGQGANIFGFGGDRELGFNIGPGRFGTQSW